MPARPIWCYTRRRCWTKAEIEFVADAHVEGIDRGDARVAAGKDRIAYDHLILATGSRNRHLEVAGADADGVTSLRGLADARQLKARLGKARRIAIIGAGSIGLQFAAVAAKLVREVSFVELAPRAMARSVSEQFSAHCEARHGGWGMPFAFGACVVDVEQASGKARGSPMARWYTPI